MVDAEEELAETVAPLGTRGLQPPLWLGLATSELCPLVVNFITSKLKLSHGASLLSETAHSASFSTLEGRKS